jgi:hypothetical protein
LEGFTQERPKPKINFPCAGVFEKKRFGICVGIHESGLFIDEEDYLYKHFQPMTFEMYCEMRRIKV